MVNIKATIVANPEVVEEYVFGGVTGVFSHMEFNRNVSRTEVHDRVEEVLQQVGIHGGIPLPRWEMERGRG